MDGNIYYCSNRVVFIRCYWLTSSKVEDRLHEIVLKPGITCGHVN